MHRDRSTQDVSTWRELQGLVFYAYVHELHGDASLPMWFAAGHAESFRGFTPAPNDPARDHELARPAPNATVLAEWRRLEAEGALPTLADVLAWSKPDRDRWGERIAGAWALVWHLRALERDEPEHPHAQLLARWYAQWKKDGDAARATAIAFMGVDRERLERELRARVGALP